MDTETMNLEALSKVLDKEPNTIKNDLKRRPQSIPPRLIIPGSSKLLWRVSDVAEWLENCRQKTVGRKRAA